MNKSITFHSKASDTICDRAEVLVRYGCCDFTSYPRTIIMNAILVKNQDQLQQHLDLETVSATRESSLFDVYMNNNDNVLQHICQFIGKNQYRFIAAINHKWYNTYVTTPFPMCDIEKDNKETQYNVSTIKHTVISFMEWKGFPSKYNSRPEVSCVCAWAAAAGNLQSLQYLHTTLQCPWDIRTTIFAARGGHVLCLQYAHENGCEWDFRVCDLAATHGHLHALQYAHEHGCPMCLDIICSAVENNHLDCLRYVYEHGCPWEYVAETTYLAICNGDLEIIKYAIRNDRLLLDRWDYAAVHGHLHILQYAHKYKYKWDKQSSYDAAIENGHTHIVEWMQKTFQF